jgi:tRNA (adenine37-N6)-methyltransferase
VTNKHRNPWPQTKLGRGTLGNREFSPSLLTLVWEPEVLSRMFTPRPIGFVSSPYKDASEVPKGLGAKHEADGVLKILPEFEPGLTDIEGFSHLIVIWEFDRSPKLELRGDGSRGSELIGTPPSDNRPHGVFATRSPRRPNPIGLTTVELLRREGIELHVRGVDMLDGTPILDIKPYLSNIPDERLRRGWLAEAEARQK